MTCAVTSERLGAKSRVGYSPGSQGGRWDWVPGTLLSAIALRVRIQHGKSLLDWLQGPLPVQSMTSVELAHLRDTGFSLLLRCKPCCATALQGCPSLPTRNPILEPKPLWGRFTRTDTLFKRTDLFCLILTKFFSSPNPLPV